VVGWIGLLNVGFGWSDKKIGKSGRVSEWWRRRRMGRRAAR
jgi:hypothetical protein